MDNASMDLIVRLLPFLVPIAAIELGLFVAAIVSICRRKKVSLLPKWAWVLICFIQIIGPIVYFILGRKESEEEEE